MRFDQARGLRKSMSWLHTWAGLVLGWLLFAIFVTGTLSYFRNEITLWMQPELHSARPDEKGLDRALALLAHVAPGAAQWQISLPGERSPVFGLGWRSAEEHDRGGAVGRAEPRVHDGESERGGLRTAAQRDASAGARGRERREGRRPEDERGSYPGSSGRAEGRERAQSGEHAALGSQGAERSARGEGRSQARGAGRVDGGEHGGSRVSMDPATGRIITPRETMGGNFLYRFHFELYGMDRTLARWIVGVATMFMFAAMVSGVIIHRNIFKDFFTFRPGKGKRSWLDAHNASSVFALPFHFMITFSGLLLFANQIMPWAATYAYGGSTRALMADMKNMHVEGGMVRTGQAAALTDVAPLIKAARQQWPQQGVGAVNIVNPGDAGARIELRQGRGESLATRAYPQSMVFDGTNGKLLEAAEPVAVSSPVRAIWSGLNALHLGRFASPLMRGLFFFSGVLGCLMVASGLVMWVVARQRDRDVLGRTPFGHRMVEVLNVTGVAGMLVATAAYFWGSRMMPAGLAGRGELEVRVFFIVWALMLPHALLRRHKRAWVEQLALAGGLSLLLPLLNGATGGAWLPASLQAGQWQVAGFDLCAVLMGVLLLFAAWKTARHVPRQKRAAQTDAVDTSRADIKPGDEQ